MDSARRFWVVPAVTITFSKSFSPPWFSEADPRISSHNIVGIRAPIVFLSCSKDETLPALFNCWLRGPRDFRHGLRALSSQEAGAAQRGSRVRNSRPRQSRRPGHDRGVWQFKIVSVKI